MATEYWDLWNREPEKWAAWVDRLTAGILPVLQRVWRDGVGVQLLPNRWDIPGFDIVVRPGSAAIPEDGAWRAVHAYVERSTHGETVQFGGAAWFDEQGPAPSEPWTRWWCHTTPDAEDGWAAAVDDGLAAARAIEETVEAVVNSVRAWRWDAATHRWLGEDLQIENPVRFSSVEPGRRID